MFRNSTTRKLLFKLTTTTIEMDFGSSQQQTTKLRNLKFDNKALRYLPVDKIEENYVRTVNNAVSFELSCATIV